MILDIYKDAFEYSGQDVKALIKLGILSFFSFLIIPEFLVMGYQYRVIENGINGMVDGDDKLPEFNNFTGMFIEGLKIFAIELAYFIIPFIVFFIFAILDNYTANATFGAIAMILGFILLILAIVYSFLAIPNMIANDGSLKAAFDYKKINEIIKMIGVGKYIGFIVGIGLINIVITAVIALILTILLSIFGIAAFALNPISAGIIPIIWTIISVAIFSFIVTPYLTIFSGRANGLIYGVGS